MLREPASKIHEVSPHFDTPLSVLNAPLAGVGAATYDTAEAVRHALLQPSRFPAGFGERAYQALAQNQNADGSWGAQQWPGRYRVIPTLAAVTALAEEPARTDDAFWRGLKYLARNFSALAPVARPDLMACEYIVPSLLENLDRALDDSAAGIAESRIADRLPPRDQAILRRPISAALKDCDEDRRRLHQLRDVFMTGGHVPVHLAHSAEILGDPGGRLRTLATTLPVGCSAAATVAVTAWSPQPWPEATRLLEQQATQLNGGLPTIMQMTTFELLWVCAAMLRSALPLATSTRASWTSWIHSVLKPDGVRAGPGLPPDGDDTATALYLLNQLGETVSPDCLRPFLSNDGCASYPGERTQSVTTNAHALEALGLWVDRYPQDAPPYRPLRSNVMTHLLESQQADGSWDDKWHASPHYATSCVATALHQYGGAPARTAVQRAIEWTRDCQREDGSWGIWTGTLEETAFALETLANSSTDDVQYPRRKAIMFLDANYDAPFGTAVRTPMWQGKELYEPHRIVSAIVTSARASANRS
jgi:halimadienyl-diphosphate synthase